jgi:hypothetical protein
MYGKYFSSTFTGSMYGAGPIVFAVWGYVIAHTVKASVELNPKMMAPIIGCTPGEIVAAIAFLSSPDPDSRNKAEEGRRLVKDGQYQYRVPSHDHYNHIRDEADRREYLREYKAKQREGEDFRDEENQQRQRRRQQSVNMCQQPSAPSANTDTETTVVDVVDVGQAHSGSCVPQKEVPGEPSPTCSAAQAAKFMKTFGPLEAEPEDEYVPSARILKLADVFGQRMKEPQALDFNTVVLERVRAVDEAPESVVHTAVAFVLDSDYWLTQISNEDAGRGALKVFIRGFAKIREFAKSAGTGKKKTYTAKAKQPVYKAASVAPDPSSPTYAPTEVY